MEAHRTSSGSADDTWDDLPALDAMARVRRDSGIRPAETAARGFTKVRGPRERGSGTELVEERATLPPPRHPLAAAESPDVLVARIHLHTSMDELLYRLAVGDWDGAYRANAELVHFVPRLVLGRIACEAADLDMMQELVLTYVDERATWGDIVSNAPFEPAETLRALSALVDLGLVSFL